MRRPQPTARITLVAALLALVAFALPVASAAGAKRVLWIRGAGYGHGVGMSQYGAYGYALNGFDHRFILAHYYEGTELTATAPSREIRVLLQAGRPSVSFRGAADVGGRRLKPAQTYTVRRAPGGRLDVVGASGRRVARLDAPLRVTGPGPLTLGRRALNGVTGGAYRGALELRPATTGGVNAINALRLDDYVRGVISMEMPSTWPLEALAAQAVAARTYALTTSAGASAGFDQYPDTRSQVYGGVSAERPSTDQAVAATAGQLVTYQGRPVTTFFFSTSGGKTENIEFSFLGSQPDPWLRSVEDPYDKLSPRHRWQPVQLTIGQAAAKLAGLVKGRLRRIDVLERGRSPRIVRAAVVGTRGSAPVTGSQLRQRLGLYDTWAYFTVISSGRALPPTPKPTPGPSPDTKAPDASGGTGPVSAVAQAARVALPVLTGTIAPARAGTRLTVERLAGGHWVAVTTTRVRRGGAYRVRVAHGATYRVRRGALTGPRVRVG